MKDNFEEVTEVRKALRRLFMIFFYLIQQN